MKRHPSLEPFSRDHNDGLIQARRLDLDGAAALPGFRTLWDGDLRDHFDEEERLLLPLCDADWGDRLRAEHAAIAARVGTAATDEEARELGTLLHDHIRWEERELFPYLERRLTEATLRSLTIETDRVERKRDNPLRAELVARRPKGPDEPPLADLAYLAAVAPGGGPRWGLETSDLNATFLAWSAGEGVAEHVNEEVDVLMVVVEGEGDVTVDGHAFRLTAGQTVAIPKGQLRSVRAVSERFAYLNVHGRRRKLALGTLPPRV
jgi:mannose-6-phosphate isomerase-like protein (cupin superfamily)